MSFLQLGIANPPPWRSYPHSNSTTHPSGNARIVRPTPDVVSAAQRESRSGGALEGGALATRHTTVDLLFAVQLEAARSAPGQVMLCLTTFGTFSVVPAIYLWRGVSRELSVALFGFFAAVGGGLALAFQMGYRLGG